MINEILLLASVVVIFGAALLAYRLFGKTGLYCMTSVALVLANIEVLMLIDAFGMEQTLGNVLFAVTFLITDILSECEGHREANRAVWIGFFTSALFLVVSQSWMLYQPAASDWAHPAIVQIFANTPRMLAASLGVYLVSQLFDVWLYHRWWTLTTRLSGSRERFLWLRNNGSTLISQIFNTALYTVLAFAGTYDAQTLFSIFVSSYVIYIFTSLLDTPALYLARHMKNAGKAGLETVTHAPHGMKAESENDAGRD